MIQLFDIPCDEFLGIVEEMWRQTRPGPLPFLYCLEILSFKREGSQNWFEKIKEKRPSDVFIMP